MAENHFSVSDIVECLEKEIGATRPTDHINPYEDWSAGVPQGSVPYLNAFRLKYFEYDRHTTILNDLFKKRGVERIVELGCGTAPHLIRLCQRGYQCTGIDTSGESLKLAALAAKEAGVNLNLLQGDAKEIRVSSKFHAVFMIYVPLSQKAFSQVLRNSITLLEQGGLFIHTDLIPRSSELPENDELIDVDVEESADFRVARLEHWWKKGKIVAWNAIYFVRQPGSDSVEPEEVQMFLDHNRMYLVTEDEKLARFELWKSAGFKLLTEIRIPYARSAPPWTQGTLIVLEKL